MYPTISDLLYDLIGFQIPLPIQTFGFFVALSFVACAYFFSSELKRKEQQGLLQPTTIKKLVGQAVSNQELVLSALFGFILGYKLISIISDYKSFVANPQSFILSLSGSVIGGIGIAAIMSLIRYRDSEKQRLKEPEWREIVQHPYELVPNMTMVAAISGIIGAKIFHNLENLDDFIADPVTSLLSFSGLTFYGGLIFGAIAVIWYARKNGIPALYLIDSCAPGLMLAYGIGRIGCHMAGDGDWGIINTVQQPAWLSFLPQWAWSYNYPHNVIGEGIAIPGCIGNHCNMLPQGVFPTPLYEAISCIAFFGILWLIRKRIKIAGALFSVYIIINGLERFFIEKIRVNTMYHLFGHGITQAEIISFALLIGGICWLFILYRKKKEQKIL